MSYTIETPKETERLITFTVDAKAVNTALESTLREYAKTIDIKGFRKGKVPHSVIEQRYKDDVYSHATDTLVNDEVNAALDAEKLRPITPVKFADKENPPKIVRDEECVFACTFDVLPEIAIPEDFSSLTVNVETPELSVDEMAKVTDQLRQSMAKLEDIEEKRKPEMDDILLVDVEGTFEGEPVPGMAAQNFQMQLREENKNKEVDELVCSIFAGEEAKGTMVCPEDFPEPTFRGKTIDLTVKLHKIQKQILPEFNDEFAKQIGFESAEKLSQAVTFQAMNNKMSSVKSKAQEELLKNILKDLDYPLPEAMVQAAVSNFMAEAQHHLGQRNMSADGMVQALAEMKEKADENAKKDTKAHVYLLSVAYKKEFNVTSQEIEAYIRQLASETRQDFEKVRNHIANSGMIHEIQERILAGKALDYIYGQAQKTVVDAQGNPVPTPSPADSENAEKTESTSSAENTEKTEE